MRGEDFSAATERINEGAEIPTIAPSLLEHLWEAMSRIPKPQSQHTGVDLGAFALCEPNLLPDNAEQHIAMMTRYALLEALVEREILGEYMDDESLRKKVFAAAASVPCNKSDLGEAMAEKLLSNMPTQQLEETRKEFIAAGYDPTHLKIGDKFMKWMRDNC